MIALTIDDIVGACASVLGLIALGICMLLTGCGGTSEPLQGAPTMTIQPVDCGGGIVCK